LEEDEDSPNDAPPAGLQVAAESGPELKTTELAKDAAASDDGCSSSSYEDDPEVLLRLLAEAQEEKVRLKMILDDPTISEEVRRTTVRLRAVAVKEVRDCDFSLTNLVPKLYRRAV
jgi:hypothetical protein